MGIAMLAAARLVQVVPAWVDGWKPLTSRPVAQRTGKPVARTVVGHTDAAWQSVAKVAGGLWARLMPRRGAGRPPFASHAVERPACPRPLRVLRVLEPHQPRAAAGRMVISGRMADVCAELDRLAEAEAASQR